MRGGFRDVGSLGGKRFDAPDEEGGVGSRNGFWAGGCEGKSVLAPSELTDGRADMFFGCCVEKNNAVIAGEYGKLEDVLIHGVIVDDSNARGGGD